MTSFKTSYNRRSFIKTSALAGGGMVLSFNALLSCKNEAEVSEALALPDNWYDFNSYLKIGDNGVVTIFVPNPEFGQNIKTSMPMIVAEELDIDWGKVIVEQAVYSQEKYPGGAFGQFTGGSQGIRRKWEALRKAGATARYMLKEAAANQWTVSADEIETNSGMLIHRPTNKSISYGEVASAAAIITIPEEITLKSPSEFKIIGKSKTNVDAKDIVTGKPMFGIDYTKEGMLIPMPIFPPAFGLTLDNITNIEQIKSMPGIRAVTNISTYPEDYTKGYFDINAFPEFVAIVGNSTWEVMNAKKQLKATWKPTKSRTDKVDRFGTEITVVTPAGLENTTAHVEQMEALINKPMKVVRKDGNPEEAFRKADRVIERTYTAPYLSHNCMEPMNTYADVRDGKARIAGPLQAPGLIEPTLSASLGIPVENIDIEMTRMGGGFGRRAYSHYMVEAALISQKVGQPIKLIYSREDDMTNGIYRPTYTAIYRAALDENNNLLAMHIKAGGVPESPLFANRFPAGAIDNYLAEEFSIDSNITTGAFRAPRSNFMAGAEQSFLDELAEEMGKDPIDLRLELLAKAKNKPVGESNDYDAARYAGVLELVRDKANWGIESNNVHRGVSAYFCHNTYAAHVLEMELVQGKPKIKKVTCAIDCGIVVNPDAAANMAEGGIIDGIGNAFFGEMTFVNGSPQKKNFHEYRMIRMGEEPSEIDVHFVKNEIDPTGLGEPPFPPIFGAVANALYKLTGQRQYKQPFLKKLEVLG